MLKKDWDRSSWKYKKTKILCPYCGNDTINFDSFKKSWRCVKCGASFIRPPKRNPSLAKFLSVLIGWAVTIAGLVHLIVSHPYWVGIIMIAVGVFINGIALALVARWR